MEAVRRVIGEYQWWFYGLLGLLLLFYLRRALLARREGARSIFKLEQEQARLRYSRSVTVLALLLILMVALFVLGNPLPNDSEPTPEPGPTVTTGPLVQPTLTHTPPPPTMTPTATATPLRPTLPPRPSPTSEVIATDTPAVRPPACPDPNVRITSPGVNQVVRGNFPVRGTANIAAFQYYKVEVGPGPNPKDQEWTVVGQLHDRPVVNGVLENFNSSAYAPGIYSLRLVVVDQTGNYPEPCRVTIRIER